MASELIKSETELNPLDAISIDADVLTKIQSFKKKYLHAEPKEGEIRKNKFANNSRYLPISFMEMTLDEIFFGLWQTKNFQTKVIANEIVGELELWYFHPVAKTWLCRIGAGAVQIQFKSVEKGGSGDITDIRDKITNTLTKDYPHLKAECFRNACLSLGKAFGRDLNREFDDQYNPVIKPAKTDFSTLLSMAIEIKDKLQNKDKQEYNAILEAKRKTNGLTAEYLETLIAEMKLKVPKDRQ
jgi:hypothetical protein